MTKNIEYYWIMEELDHEGDIVDVYHYDTFPGLHPSIERAVALVCDDDKHGRSWAYIKDNQLPESFLDAYDHKTRKVPAIYRKQFNNHKKD